MSVALVGPIPQWAAPRDAIAPPQTKTSYTWAILHIARCWRDSKPQELEWFVKSTCNARISDDIPVNTIPETSPASPRVGEFGKRGCDCCATRIYRTNEAGHKVATERRSYIRLATGSFRCTFSNDVRLMDLCAICAFREAFIKWNGAFTAKLEKVELMVTYDREDKGDRVSFYFSPSMYEKALELATTKLGIRDEEMIPTEQEA